ncbi:MAG: hypothetical protein Q9172_006101, partial [Xanthocarpia lactea]
MNRDIPFEEYMPEGSQRLLSPPSYSSTPELDSSYHHQSDTTSTWSESPSSISSIDGPHNPSKEISHLEQEVIGLCSMSRLDDESGLESEWGDDYGGGVSLAGHEDTMDVGGPVEETPEQTLVAGPGILPSVATSTEPGAFSIAEELDHDHGSGGEMTIEDDASESLSFGALKGYDVDQTAESSGETSNLQDIPQIAASVDPTVQLNLPTSLPDQDSPDNPLQPIPSNGVSSFLQTYETTLNELYEQPYPQIDGWYTDTLDQSVQFCDEQRNFSLVQCLRYCSHGHILQQKSKQSVAETDRFPHITDHYVSWGMEKRKGGTIASTDRDFGKYDVQGIDWHAFGIHRDDARRMRRNTYLNPTNLLKSYPHHRIFNRWPMFASAQDMNLTVRRQINPIPHNERYFRFSRMSLQHPILIPHFQLRHIVSASSRNAIFFPTVSYDEDGLMTTGSEITNFNPEVDNDSYTINSAHVDPNLDTCNMHKIYALSAKNDVLVAGGLGGEYAYKSLSSTPSGPFTSGMITHAELSSTNHIHTYLSRQSGLPQAVFSSNDSHIHTMDLTTNTFISRHNHGSYVNCSATSPDSRLRVLVRDAIHPLIVEADTGRRIGKLTGHRDFGFACDWADDGRYFATGAQDGVVQIFDMRKWRAPVKKLLTEIGGVRSLAFSPAGDGKRVLLMAESADFVHIVDASDGRFGKKQTVDFFGEIAG